MESGNEVRAVLEVRSVTCLECSYYSPWISTGPFRALARFPSLLFYFPSPSSSTQRTSPTPCVITMADNNNGQNKKGPMLTTIGKLRRMTRDGSYNDKGIYTLMPNEIIKLRSIQGQPHHSMNEINERIMSLERITHINKPISKSDTDQHPATYFDAQSIPRIHGNGDVPTTSTVEHCIFASGRNKDSSAHGGYVHKNSKEGAVHNK